MEIYLICNRVGDFEQYFMSFIDAYFPLNSDKKYFGLSHALLQILIRVPYVL